MPNLKARKVPAAGATLVTVRPGGMVPAVGLRLAVRAARGPAARVVGLRLVARAAMARAAVRLLVARVVMALLPAVHVRAAPAKVPVSSGIPTPLPVSVVHVRMTAANFAPSR